MTTPTSTFRLVSACLSLLVVLTPSVTAKVWAREKLVTSFEPPPGRDAPRGGTAGGGSRPVRTACLPQPRTTSTSLTALVPGRQLGLTQENRPNFLVYLPQTNAKTVEFSLYDEKMNGIYQVSVPVPNQAGLVNLRLPENAPALVKDKPYYWSFALVCNAADRTEDWVVGGWIEYAEPNANVQQELAQVAGIEDVSVYAKNGFWYDAITELVELQQATPNHPQLAKTWIELLQSVGLDAIAKDNRGNLSSRVVNLL